MVSSQGEVGLERKKRVWWDFFMKRLTSRFDV
jgi:hypothetical protein